MRFVLTIIFLFLFYVSNCQIGVIGGLNNSIQIEKNYYTENKVRSNILFFNELSPHLGLSYNYNLNAIKSVLVSIEERIEVTEHLMMSNDEYIGYEYLVSQSTRLGFDLIKNNPIYNAFLLYGVGINLYHQIWHDKNFDSEYNLLNFPLPDFKIGIGKSFIKNRIVLILDSRISTPPMIFKFGDAKKVMPFFKFNFSLRVNLFNPKKFKPLKNPKRKQTTIEHCPDSNEIYQ